MSIRTRFNPLGTIGRKSLLPSGYIELEYLESTGAQYIDTGIVPDNLTGLWELSSKRVKSEDYVSSGARSNLTRFYGYCAARGSEVSYGRGNYYYSGYSIANWDDYCDYKHNYRNSREITANNHVLASNIITISGITSNIIMFGYSLNTTTNVTKCRSRIKYLKLTQDKKLVRNFIPALSPTGRPCMFDTVTQQPFYNKGTGEFLYGYKLPKGYTALEYIESVGARQYIDTGVVPQSDYTIEADAMFINPVALSTVYWCREYLSSGISYPSFGLLSANAPSGNMRLRVYHSAPGSANLGIYDVNLQSGQRFSFEAKAGEFYVNDTKTTMPSPSSYTPVTTIGLFWLHQDGSWFQGSEPATTSSVRAYSFKVKYNSGNIKQYLVPALDKTSKPCMYDLVKRKTYYNQGTGEFLYG